MHLGPLYCPQVNTVERYNRTVMTAVASFVENDHRAWDVNIHKIQFAINTSVNESTSFTPFMLVHGREAVTDGSIYKNFKNIEDLIVQPRDEYADNLGHLQDIFKKVQVSLRKAHDKNIKHYNNTRRDISFEVGDFVWKRTYKQSATLLRMIRCVHPCVVLSFSILYWFLKHFLFYPVWERVRIVPPPSLPGAS